jgi:hypothetical protein
LIPKLFFFFFFIGKSILLKKNSKCIKHALKEMITMEKQNYQKLMIRKNLLPRKMRLAPIRETNQSRNQIILPTKLSIFSKVGLFLSRHMVHIKQDGTMFHTPKEVFPNQFHHPKRSSTIRSESTQTMPKDQTSKLHNSLATPQ